MYLQRSSFFVLSLIILLLTPNAGASAEIASSTFDQYDSVQIEAKVRASFTDAPVMAAVAKCESDFNQFDPQENVLHGGAGGTMIGIFQIGEGVHKARALSLGFDINTVDGNIGYARYLYSQSGTDPWISSFPCWNPLVKTTGSAPASSLILTKDLTFGVIDPQVVTLQQLLNLTQFKVATDGPGSPGNETTKFGALTRAAVRMLQCKEGIVCSGDEYSTGYGLMDSRTRAMLSALTANNQGPSASSGSDDSTQIAALQQQIAELLKIVSDLQQKLLALKNSNVASAAY